MGGDAQAKRATSSVYLKDAGSPPPESSIKWQVAHLSGFLAALGIVVSALAKFKPVPECGLFFLRTSFFIMLFSPNGNKC